MLCYVNRPVSLRDDLYSGPCPESDQQMTMEVGTMAHSQYIHVYLFLCACIIRAVS